MGRAPRRGGGGSSCAVALLSVARSPAAPSARRSGRRWRCAGRTCRRPRRRRRAAARSRPDAPRAGAAERDHPVLRLHRRRARRAPAPVPAGRALQVECGEITVPADPEQPGLGAGDARGGHASARPGRPRTGRRCWCSATRGASRRRWHAVVLAGQVDPALLQRYTLVGLDRRGAGAGPAATAPRRTPAPRSWTPTPRPPARPSWPSCWRRPAAVVQECNHHPRRRAGQLPHRGVRRRHRAAARGARGGAAVRGRRRATAPPRWPAGPGCGAAVRRAAGARRAPAPHAGRARPHRVPRRRRRGRVRRRSRWPAPRGRTARWAPTRAPPSPRSLARLRTPAAGSPPTAAGSPRAPRSPRCSPAWASRRRWPALAAALAAASAGDPARCSTSSRR